MSRGRTLPTRTTATRAEASRACPPTDLARRAAKPGTTSRDWRAGGTSGRRRARPRDAPVSPPPPRATSSSGRSWSSARASPGRRATTRRPRVRPRTKTRPRLLPGAPEAVLRTAAKGRLPALATSTVTEQKSVSCARKRDKKKAKRDHDDDDVDFCRICLDSIRREEVESFSSSSFSNANAADGPIGDFGGERGERERGEQPSRGAFHLGCACTGGYMHFSCAALYVAKRCSTDLTCEICLEQMENLRSLRDRRVEARRRANRARVALLVLNGASAEDIRRERRRRRGGDDDDDDEAMRFRVGDARADAFGWGSRNPCVWVLWVLSRPLIAIAWVRRENASPFFLRLSRLVFFFFSPGAFFGFSFFSKPLTRDRPGVRPRCTLRVQNFADALRARVLGHAVLQLVQVLLTFSASLWFFALAAALGYLLFAWRDDFGNGEYPSAYERDATGRTTEP